MIGPLGRLVAAATPGQPGPQMTQRRCSKCSSLAFPDDRYYLSIMDEAFWSKPPGWQFHVLCHTILAKRHRHHSPINVDDNYAVVVAEVLRLTSKEGTQRLFRNAPLLLVMSVSS